MLLSCAAPGMGGVGDGTQRPETAISFDQETRVKAAERMIAARGHEASDRGYAMPEKKRREQPPEVTCIWSTG